MKKILACTVSAILALSMFTACGDKEEDTKDKSETKATTTTAAEEEKTEESKAEEESEAEDESTADEESKSDDSEEEEAEPIPIDKISESLTNYETASLKFDTKMDPKDFASSFGDTKGKYDADESKVNLSIEEVGGVPMLKIEALDQNDNGEWKVPKVNIAMNKLFKGNEKVLPNIFEIKLDVVTKAVEPATNDDGEDVMAPAWAGGKIATCPRTDAGTDKASNGWNELIEWSVNEWTSEWGYAEVSVRPGIKDAAKFIETDEDQFLSIMKWSIKNKADLYIADITFLDEDGNVIECNYGK